VLRDVLAPGLALVVCGSAAGHRSAALGWYYAGPGNKFWRTLAETGLTPARLEPKDCRRLPRFGIGLTDVAKGQAGADHEIDFARSDPAALRAKIERCAPAILCFNGKRAAQVFLGRRRVTYGFQPERLGATRIYVAPSTSGAASGAWDVSHWRRLARSVERKRKSR
jgi:TDG/mug DNA glycosylase family protein